MCVCVCVCVCVVFKIMMMACFLRFLVFSSLPNQACLSAFSFLLLYLPVSCLILMLHHQFHFSVDPCFPQPGMERLPPAVETLSFNHWTARVVQSVSFFKKRKRKWLFSFCLSSIMISAVSFLSFF